MTPAIQIVLGLFFLVGGGFVVLQGVRAHAARPKDNPKPWPKFFLFAFVVHGGIALIGLFLIGRSLLALMSA